MLDDMRYHPVVRGELNLTHPARLVRRDQLSQVDHPAGQWLNTQRLRKVRGT